MTLLALVTVALSAHQVMPSPGSYVLSFLLLPVAEQPIIGVAWTLQHEITFYAVFLTLLLNYALGIKIFLMWFGVIVAQQFASGMNLAAVSSLFNVHFFIGMGAAWLLRHYTVPSPKAVLWAGIVIFLCAGLAEDAGLFPGLSYFTHLGYGVGSGLTILGLVEAERQNRLHVPRIMTALGGASYSIYLTHLMSIGAVWQIMLAAHVTDLLPPRAQFVTLFTGASVGGWVISRLIEHPTTEIARWLTTPKPLPAEPAPITR
jgi:exopolysaccharide production protein ExoZ